MPVVEFHHEKSVCYLCKARPADMHNQYFWGLERARFADKPEPQPGNRTLHQEPRSNSNKLRGLTLC